MTATANQLQLSMEIHSVVSRTTVSYRSYFQSLRSDPNQGSDYIAMFGGSLEST